MHIGYVDSTLNKTRVLGQRRLHLGWLLLVGLLPFVVAGARASEFSFDGRRALAVGYRPTAVELVDLDFDDDLDLVVVNRGDFIDDVWQGCSIQVFLNPGNGFFEASTVYPVPSAPSSLAVCDLDGDGWPDLATPNAAPDNLSVLLNNGDGTFTPGAVIPVSIDPVDIVCADFDGNEAVDLASADQFGFGVSVVFNLGGGTFAPAVFYGLDDLVNALEVGDVDNDSDEDLVVSTNSGLLLLPNTGSGTFGEARPIEITGPEAPKTLCWLDDDENLDLVSGIRVWYGNGDGTFDPVGIPTYLPGTTARCCDFDSDGDRDVVTTYGVSIANADGTFAYPPIDFDQSSQMGAIACGNFMEDDEVDLARVQGVNYERIGFVALLPGRGGGTVQGYPCVDVGDSLWDMTAGLIDDDPYLDLVVANVGTPFPEFLNGSVSVLTGNGDGTLDPFVSYPAGDRVRTVEVADLGGDAAPDAVVTNFDDATVSVFINDGAGGLQPRVTYNAGDQPEAVALADFDGTAGVDIAVANYRSGEAPGMVMVLLADGLGGYAAPAPYTLPCAAPSDIIAARLNEDEHVDLAVVCVGRYVGGEWIDYGMSVLFNNGDGTFGPGLEFSTPMPREIEACDVDVDGDVDIVVSASGQLLVFQNDGSGAFSTLPSTDLGQSFYAMECGHLNLDEYPDLAGLLDGSALTLLPGNGDGTFGQAEHYATYKSPWAVVIGDMNGDGQNDLAIGHYVDHAGAGVGILLNTQSSSPIPVVSRWGLAIMIFLLLTGATIVIHQRTRSNPRCVELSVAEQRQRKPRPRAR